MLLCLLPPVLLFLGGLEGRIFTNGSVRVDVDLFDVLRADIVSEIGGELLAETLLILERLHVLQDVSTEDIFLEDLGVERFGLWVEAGERLVGVGDKDAAIGCTLLCTENTDTRRGAAENDIEVALEGPGRIFLIERCGELVSAVWFTHTRVLVSEADLGENTACAKEASRICLKQI